MPFTCSKRRDAGVFRVGMHDSAREFRLRLEGPVTAAHAPEVEQRWRTAATIIGTRAFRVDLRAVTYVDASGRGLLARLRERGAELIADTPETTRLVSEISGTWLPQSAPEQRRGLAQAIRDVPAFLACLFSHVRAWAN